MNTLAIITKIELKKLFQRKDSWLMFTILLVPILYSVGLASNSDVITYTGAGNITAIGFASAMFQMSQSMFIFNVILSAIVGRSLASEIENKSIRLYVNRIGVRKLIYGGKELALLIFSVFIDILLVITSIAFYYAVLIHNPKVASGIFYDSNVGMEIVQIVCNCIFWLITIFLVMLMATRLKTLVCVGVYMILYIIMNLMSYIDGIKYLSPLHYVVAVSSNSPQITFSIILFFLYSIPAFESFSFFVEIICVAVNLLPALQHFSEPVKAVIAFADLLPAHSHFSVLAEIISVLAYVLPACHHLTGFGAEVVIGIVKPLPVCSCNSV